MWKQVENNGARKKMESSFSWAHRVHVRLLEQGFETPGVTLEPLDLKGIARQTMLEEAMRNMLAALSLDATHEDFEKSPTRVARHWLHEAFRGLDYAHFPMLSFSHLSEHGRHPQVSIRKIRFTSHCAHHFVPMEGVIDVTYRPKLKLLGLSKVHRLSRFFAARPQLQERLTAQLSIAFQEILETPNVFVQIAAKHHCVTSRGIQDEASVTETKLASGCFALLNDETF